MKRYTIKEAAEAVGVTNETLRHYDRINLVQPSRRDTWTGYRYYTEQDVVRLKTVRALQQMDLPLREIRQVMAYDNLEDIVAFLEKAERRAEEKIASLEYSLEKIRLARQDYQAKLLAREQEDKAAVRRLPERVILLSESMEQPTLENLWSYQRHFYNQVGPDRREAFSFEDVAGVYRENGVSRLFAVCTRYEDGAGLRTLPAGDYLCASCAEEARADTEKRLRRLASAEYSADPAFTVEQVVVTALLNWSYQVQIYLGSGGDCPPPMGAGRAED
ncbi:MAG: MerR family transcriptional regulator [Oscillospiraceae bacterium]|nr:MerR family transcriptional regulator [Oscillospiraceae bacterium]